MNPLFVPNTSAIPNVLFDYWMAKLSPAEFKVIMCISRKTYGWHKCVDSISVSQIEKMTGLSRRSIFYCIEKLVNMQLINKIKSLHPSGDDDTNKFEINMYFKEEITSATIAPGVVQSLHQGVVQPLHPQKKTYTKENIQKNTPPTPKGESGGAVKEKPKIAEKETHLEFVKLTKEEYAKLLELYGEKILTWMIDALNSYIGSHGKKYNSHYHVLQKNGWVYKRYQEDSLIIKPSNNKFPTVDRRTLDKDGKPVEIKEKF